MNGLSDVRLLLRTEELLEEPKLRSRTPCAPAGPPRRPEAVLALVSERSSQAP